jgi:hypothetical protein
MLLFSRAHFTELDVEAVGKVPKRIIISPKKNLHRLGGLYGEIQRVRLLAGEIHTDPF